MNGRAALLIEPNRDMVIREFPVPDPEPGAVVIRVTRCNICGSDVHAWQGNFKIQGLGASLPAILGHEMVGRILALGEGVLTDSWGQSLHEGDRVVFPYFNFCGHCPSCTMGFPLGCQNLHMAMLGNPQEFPYFVGGFADYYYLPPRHVLFKVPNTLSDDVVSGANCALSQVIYGFSRSGLTMGESVVIQGAGGLGLYALVAAKQMGASPIVVLDAFMPRLELARSFGADVVVHIDHYGVPERVRMVRKVTAGLGVDHAMDVSGNPSAMVEGLSMVRPGGHYIEIGSINLGKTVEIDPSRLVFGNKTIIGVSLYEPFALKKALELLSHTQGRLPFQSLLQDSFPLSQINEALQVAVSRRANRATVNLEME